MTVTNRVLKPSKVIRFSFSNLAADAMLTDSTGVSYVDISDVVNPSRIVLETNITALTGTSVIFKAVTTNDPNNSGATTDPALVAGDGSTAFASTSQTATGRTIEGISMFNSTSANCSNLGKYIGVWADTTSITDLDGEVLILIQGGE